MTGEKSVLISLPPSESNAFVPRPRFGHMAVALTEESRMLVWGGISSQAMDAADYIELLGDYIPQ